MANPSLTTLSHTPSLFSLFIAVIVNAVQTMLDDEHKEEIDTEKAAQQQLLEQMQQLQLELKALRRDINKPQE